MQSLHLEPCYARDRLRECPVHAKTRARANTESNRTRGLRSSYLTGPDSSPMVFPCSLGAATTSTVVTCTTFNNVLHIAALCLRAGLTAFWLDRLAARHASIRGARLPLLRWFSGLL